MIYHFSMDKMDLRPLDCVLLTMPLLPPHAPLVGPAKLKAFVEEQGFRVKCVDFNLELFNGVSGSVYEKFYQSRSWEYSWLDPLEFEKFNNDFYRAFVEEKVREILEMNPRWVGVSVFSSRSDLSTEYFLKVLKKMKPSQKVVMGGPQARYLGDEFLTQGLVDVFCSGDGEQFFLDLLENKENIAANDKKPQQFFDLNSAPFADYSDARFDQYTSIFKNDEKGCSALWITGSRGCVRDCSFCNIGVLWSKYVFASGERVAREMLHLQSQYKIDTFIFTDSLLNGSIKNLKEMCHSLIEKKTKEKPLKWFGQHIVRPKNTISPSLFDLLKEAGCIQATIGVESGSFDVRKRMGKAYTNDDIDYTMEQFHRVGIKVRLLMIIGFPEETEEEFSENIELLKRYKEYAASGHISDTFFSICEILPDTKLYSMYKRGEIQIDPRFGSYLDDPTSLWVDKYGLDIFERLERHKRVLEAVEVYGFPIYEKGIYLAYDHWQKLLKEKLNGPQGGEKKIVGWHAP